MSDAFTFLFSYDFHSVVERKNPRGVIDAYTRAFGPDDGATLMLKSINGHAHPNELDRIRHAAAHRPDIVVRPTLKGIRAGRDEVLERALRYLNAPSAAKAK